MQLKLLGLNPGRDCGLSQITMQNLIRIKLAADTMQLSGSSTSSPTTCWTSTAQKCDPTQPNPTQPKPIQAKPRLSQRGASFIGCTNTNKPQRFVSFDNHIVSLAAVG